MDLKFVATAGPEKANPTTQRREKLVRRIDQQIGYTREIATGQAHRAAWVWMADSGKYILPIKYGRHPIELKKGMFAIECPDIDHAEAALVTIRAMVLKGEFDGQIEKIASDIRSRFKR
jgi:hypothetical protein